MKIQIVSDLHLQTIDDIDNLKIRQIADILVVSGDVANLPTVRKEFLNQMTYKFPHVIFVAGNHDYYNASYMIERSNYMAMHTNIENFNFLDSDFVVIDDTLFYGCTLWTKMENKDLSKYQYYLQDMKNIHNMSSYDVMNTHDTEMMLLDRKLKSIDAADDDGYTRRVVVTHHAPSKRSISEQYEKSHINNFFVNDIALDQYDVDLWIHGHTHTFFDYVEDDVRVVCNPYGYESSYGKEETGYKHNFVVEI